MADDPRPPRAAVRAAVAAGLADLTPGERVVVGCSGGPDSLALLAAALVVARDRGLLVTTVVVDHGLQPRSAEVAARAAAQARILGCDDVRVVAVTVDRGPGSGGIEAAARRARYGALLRTAGRAAVPAPADEGAGDIAPGVGTDATGPGGAAAILLGHTRDDQAETVLLGLARGSGTRSLAGMAARDGLLRRPLLDLPRAVVAAAAAQEAATDDRLAPWPDPHNADPAFARVRVREQALPALDAALGPGVVEALARTARLARADADALDAWADRIWARIAPARAPDEAGARDAPGQPPPGFCAPVQAMTGGGGPELDGDADAADRRGAGDGHRLDAGRRLPDAVVTRLVRRALLAAGCPAGALTAEHVERVTALLDRPATRAEVALPGGLRARREADLLLVRA